MNRLIGMLRGIWADLRHGKDIELYITVPVAVVVTVANLLGQASAKVVTAVTLALLTLLTVALLKLRRQSDRLHTAIDHLEQPDDLIGRLFRNEHDSEEVKSLIKGARNEVWLWGSVLADHIGLLAPYLERAILRGLVVKVLLIKPAPSGVMTMAVLRSGHTDDTELQHMLNANLYRLRQSAGRITSQAASDQHHGRLEVRTVDYLAPYAMFAYDPDLPTGRMDVRIAGLQVDVDTRPTFTVTAANAGRWYQHFKEQFEAAWRLAEERS
jgi:hypothetical protein